MSILPLVITPLLPAEGKRWPRDFVFFLVGFRNSDGAGARARTGSDGGEHECVGIVAGRPGSVRTLISYDCSCGRKVMLRPGLD
jgi:hypothetical protein